MKSSRQNTLNGFLELNTGCSNQCFSNVDIHLKLLTETLFLTFLLQNVATLAQHIRGLMTDD